MTQRARKALDLIAQRGIEHYTDHRMMVSLLNQVYPETISEDELCEYLEGHDTNYGKGVASYVTQAWRVIRELRDMQAGRKDDPVDPTYLGPS